jgi:paraquat-inducible protein B
VRRLDAETIPAANALLADTRQIARRVDAETIPAVTQLLAQVRQLAVQFETALEATRVAVEQVQKFAAAADAAVSDRGPLLHQVDSTLQEVSGAARSIRALADYLERHPDALIFGKTGK